MNGLSKLLLYGDDKANEAIVKTLYKLAGGSEPKVDRGEVLNSIAPLPAIPTQPVQRDENEMHAKIDLLEIQIQAAEERYVLF
jgi:hypothetical protein